MERNPPHPAEVKAQKVLLERRKSGKAIVDLADGVVPRYKEDWSEGCMNKTATDHLIQAAREEWGAYPLTSAPLGVKKTAISTLKESVTDFLMKTHDMDATAENTMIGQSTSGCFMILNLALVSPGDEIITVEPAHYVFQELIGVLMAEGDVRTVSSDPNDNWEPNFEELRKKIGEHTKAIVVTHPTNPTGRIYSDKTIKQLVDIAGEYDLPIMSDEIYQLITYDGLKAKSVARLAGDVSVIVVGSTSKFFMKPGWCVGYAYFHDPLDKMEKLRKGAIMISETPGYGATRIATPILVAAAKTFADDRAINESFEWVRSLQAKRDFTCKRINESEGLSVNPPQAALYALARVDEIGQGNSRWADDCEFALDLLSETGIQVIPGSRFGPSASGHVRTLLYRKMSVLEDAWDRIEAFMKRRK
jgi:aspartate/methionine/tyrosine aminotransferase